MRSAVVVIASLAACRSQPSTETARHDEAQTPTVRDAGPSVPALERDHARFMLLKPARAAGLEEKRGYHDLAADDPWSDWKKRSVQ